VVPASANARRRKYKDKKKDVSFNIRYIFNIRIKIYKRG